MWGKPFTLLVAATPLETEWLRSFHAFEQKSEQLFITEHPIPLCLLHTGIGMVNTALHVGIFLAQYTPTRAIQLGIAGSFRREIPLAQVVEVREDTFSELGAQDRQNFLSLEALGFPSLQKETTLYYNTFTNPYPSLSSLPQVTALTVNTVHGEENAIRQTHSRWNKDIESMEGAAFFQTMLHFNIPFASFRGISNYVEPRDKSKWQIKAAVENVQQQVSALLTHWQ